VRGGAAVIMRSTRNHTWGTQSPQNPQRRICFTGLAAFAFNVWFVAAIVALAAALSGSLAAQRGGQQPPASARAIAPYDFTGYWVSVVTEDWRWRMMTPAKGDYASVPLNAEATRVADAWDPQRTKPPENSAAPTARRQSCACPAGSTSRGRTTPRCASTPMPGRRRACSISVRRRGQTRSPSLTRYEVGVWPANASWQGQSVALWESSGGGRRGSAPVLGGSLR